MFMSSDTAMMYNKLEIEKISFSKVIDLKYNLNNILTRTIQYISSLQWFALS